MLWNFDLQTRANGVLEDRIHRWSTIEKHRSGIHQVIGQQRRTTISITIQVLSVNHGNDKTLTDRGYMEKRNTLLARFKHTKPTDITTTKLIHCRRMNWLDGL